MMLRLSRCQRSASCARVKNSRLSFEDTALRSDTIRLHFAKDLLELSYAPNVMVVVPEFLCCLYQTRSPSQDGLESVVWEAAHL